MKLVICEKPSVSKSIASALGVTSRADGYFEGGGWLISWCIPLVGRTIFEQQLLYRALLEWLDHFEGQLLEE